MDRLKTLHFFVRLVELGSFSAAARELRVQQSTASKWLRTLEEELGGSLLQRTTRQQRLTSGGERFYRRSKELLALYEEASAELQSDHTEPSGRIRVSAPVVFGKLFVVPAVAEFLARFRRMEVELVLNERYVRLVEEGFDLAVRVGVPEDSTLKARVVGTTPRRVVAAPSYLERHGIPRTPLELNAHQCLVHSDVGTQAAWTFRHGKQVVRCQVGGRVVVNNSEALRALVRSGLGVGVLAGWLVDDDLAQGELVQILAGYELPLPSVQLVMAPNAHSHPRTRSFVDFLAEQLAARFAP